MFYLQSTPKHLADGPADVSMFLFVHVKSEILIGLEISCLWQTFTVKSHVFFQLLYYSPKESRRQWSYGKSGHLSALDGLKAAAVFFFWLTASDCPLPTHFLLCNMQFSVPSASHVLFTTEHGFESNTCARCNHLKRVQPKETLTSRL